MIRNYHGFACEEYLGGVTSFIAILILLSYVEGAALLAMERTFTGPLHGMISEIEEFGLRL